MKTLDPDYIRVFIDALDHVHSAAGGFVYFGEEDRRPPAGTFRACERALHRALMKIENAFCRLDRMAYGKWLEQQQQLGDYEPCDEWKAHSSRPELARHAVVVRDDRRTADDQAGHDDDG